MITLLIQIPNEGIYEERFRECAVGSVVGKIIDNDPVI